MIVPDSNLRDQESACIYRAIAFAATTLGLPVRAGFTNDQANAVSVMQVARRRKHRPIRVDAIVIRETQETA